MFIPLHDANALKHIRLQYVTIGLIIVNVLVWLFTGVLASETEANAATLGLGFIPAVVFDYAYLEPALQIVPDDLTAVTYAFVHLDFWHLAGNMLFLWVFGDNVEDALGHLRFLIFYLACAIAGALFHGMVSPMSQGPLIGASGAVSGIVAAYFLLHPKVRVWVLVFMRIPLPLPAFVPLALWIGQQFLMLVLGLEENVSWGAHVGGIIAGAILVVFLRRRGVPLFDRTIVPPRAAQFKNTSQTTESPWSKGQYDGTR
ncbi:rhomboid family intramembrane serine protease [Agrobacterium sp. NPDC090273]|uniref:rhomboid family intramembrane serine protease n=1 Tax=Agrobacterium TaxID=357 RepID=UPI0021CE5CB3|nr:rhomboid family intramembrane serine protease [Agrobacterium tumefaciens]UXS04573.1 rhomboid family intramembrane serine protease [Agrobacterium tumefaciens]